MNTRMFFLMVLLVMVIGGLIAGLFAGAIQRALTLPNNTRPITVAGQPTKAPTVQNKPVMAPTLAPSPTKPQQMPTVMLAQDNFQRANQTLWGMASDGRQWEGQANTQGFATFFSIAGNQGQITGGAQPAAFDAVLGPQKANVDVVVKGMVQNFNGQDNLGIVARWTDADHWYKALIDGTRFQILMRNGESKPLKTMNFQAQVATLYTLRLRVIGATLFAKVWRSDVPEPQQWMLTVMDTTLTTGRVGVRCVVQNNNMVSITSFMASTASSLV